MNELLLRRRIAVINSAPSLPYDAEVEYLQSNGTQYINLGIYGNGNYIVDAKGIRVSGSEIVLGTRSDGVGGSYFGKPGNSVYWGFSGSRDGVTNINFETQVLAEITLSSTGISGYINGTYRYRTINVTQQDWTLFACPNGNYPFLGYVYSFKGYQNGVLVRDMIPVRVGTTGYMYDKVSRTLFGNDGTGNFGIGNDIT